MKTLLFVLLNIAAISPSFADYFYDCVIVSPKIDAERVHARLAIWHAHGKGRNAYHFTTDLVGIGEQGGSSALPEDAYPKNGPIFSDAFFTDMKISVAERNQIRKKSFVHYRQWNRIPIIDRDLILPENYSGSYVEGYVIVHNGWKAESTDPDRSIIAKCSNREGGPELK